MPPGQKVAKARGNEFFQDVGEEDLAPIMLSVPITEHPDSVLRKLGIIVQQGRWRMKDVEFDPRYGLWRNIKTRQKLDLLRGRDVHVRRDELPYGVVLLLGSVDTAILRRPESNMEKLSRADTKIQNQMNRLVNGWKGKNPKHDLHVQEVDPEHDQLLGATGSSSINAGTSVTFDLTRATTVDYEQLPTTTNKSRKSVDFSRANTTVRSQTPSSDAPVPEKELPMSEAAVLVKQYLSNSIPRAVRQMGAAIVNFAGGDVPIYLGDGISGLDKQAPKQGDSDHISRFYTLGVHPISVLRDLQDQQASGRMPDKTKVHGAFTHHLFLHQAEDTKVLRDFDDQQILEDPSRQERLRFVYSMLEELARGFSPSDDKAIRDQPPARDPVHCCAIVIGGNRKTLKFELIRCVANKWPILIIEGTGGYADVLASTFSRVEELAPQAGVDEYRKLLSTTDPMTSEILNNGVCTVVKRSTKPDDLMRLIEKNISGDEMLVKAWKEYATWWMNSNRQQAVYRGIQFTILVMGIMATGFAITMTFLLLIWDNIQPREQIPRSELLVVVWRILQWTVISLPIVISLFQALNNRLNPGGKWVFLKKASEELLTEIYFYRTGTGRYSVKARDPDRVDTKKAPTKENKPTTTEQPKNGIPKGPIMGKLEIKQEAVEPKKKADAAPVGAPEEEDDSPLTKEQKLQKRLTAISTYLVGSEVQGITLAEYLGPLPPKHILANGDHGFNPLSPDAFVRVRLIPKMEEKQRESYYWHGVHQTLQSSIHVCNALGTGFAAFASYRWGALQAWVAFTTCLVNSLTRYGDYTKVEWLHKKYNKTSGYLGGIVSWWAALGPRADTSHNRGQLVNLTEQFVQEEVDAWGQQLQKALAKEKAAVKEQNAELMKTLKEQEGYKQAMKDLGMTDFDTEAIMNAIADPEGPQFGKLLGAMGELAKKIGPLEEITQVVEQVEEALPAPLTDILDEAKVALANLEEFNIKKLANITASALGKFDVVPRQALDLMKDPEMRNKFFHAAKAVGMNPNYVNLMQMMKSTVGDRLGSLTELPQRQYLEMAKKMLVEEITSHVFSDFDLDKIDIIPPEVDLEDFLSEFRSMTLDKEVLQMRDDNLINLIKNSQVKHAMYRIPATLRNSVLRKLVNGVQAIFDPVKNNPFAKMFENILMDITDLDMDELYRDPDVNISMVTATEKLLGSNLLNPDMMDKADLLDMMPTNMAQKLLNKSQAQIANYMKLLSSGTPGSLMFERLEQALKGEYSRPIQLLKDLSRDLRERFVLCCGVISQTDISRLSKAALMKRIRNHRYFNEELNQFLQCVSGSEFVELLSAFQASFSNSYAGRQVDKLADEIASFDIRELLPPNTREKFVKKITSLGHIDASSLSKVDILGSLGFPDLIETCNQLGENQLREMVSKVEFSLTNIFQIRALKNVFVQPEVMHTFNDNPAQKAVVLEWVNDKDFLDRLSMVSDDTLVTKINDNAFHDTNDLLKFLGDNKLDHHLKQLDLAIITNICKTLYNGCGDRILMNTFEDVATKIDSPQDYTVFHEVFDSSINRELFVQAMENIVHFTPAQVIQTPTPYVMELLGSKEPRVAEMLQQLTTDSRLQKNEFELDFAHKLVAMIVSELQTSLPYRIFSATASIVKTVDIRNIVSDSNDRYTLPILVVRLIAEGLVEFEEGMSRQPTISNDRPPISCKDEDTTIRISSNRKVVLKALREKGASDELVTELRIISDSQLKKVCEVLITICDATVAGSFFKKYLAYLYENQTPEECVIRRHTEHAMWSLKGHMKLRSKELLHAIGSAKTFAQRLETEKKKILHGWIDNEIAIEYITDMDERTLNDYWVHLFAPPHIFQDDGRNDPNVLQGLKASDTIESVRKRKTEAWKEIDMLVRRQVGAVSSPMASPGVGSFTFGTGTSLSKPTFDLSDVDDPSFSGSDRDNDDNDELYSDDRSASFTSSSSDSGH